MTSTLGLTPFRAALAIEIFANIISLPSLLLNPTHALSMLASSPAEAVPAARSLTQWFGGIVALCTVPLVLSWPDPERANDKQVGFRRATYITLGAGEVFLLGILGTQWIKGESESGLKRGAVVFLMGNMAVLCAMRGVFLYVKREWLEGTSESGKKGQ